ncbi:uncharacterized protein isoform X2 [Rhodnius prolixus]|uniref:uncharacterized protein isoform X2 n=1 Tax=Rhodnius prolixus TaxID=13249 RepID=UPI003D18D03D
MPVGCNVNCFSAPSKTSPNGQQKVLCNCCKESICPCCKKEFELKESGYYEIVQREKQRSKLLMKELPLFDDNFHLLGYLPEGTFIKGPYCLKSNDTFVEQINAVGNSESRFNTDCKCPPECKNAAKKGKFAALFPRWVNRDEYDSAARSF